jgi:glycosyltransferase involved in cell wall biosynthesis
MKIAIIDIIGLPYDGTTVYNQGLGGSESAVTFMAESLAKLDFLVTVFNNCNIDDAKAGIFNNVTYRPISDLQKDHIFDVVISSRTIIPFVDPNNYHLLQDNRAFSLQSYNLYERIVSKASLRILWMHDTFCLGDNLIEELAVSNRITDIFTLSDFHLTYVANCHHGRRRNFEVLKSKMFITRNGANCYVPEVDITAKDKNLFVYNASVTKGMVPLINDIWPIVKNYIPSAKLKIIGGYYRFSSASEPDQQEKDWRQMVANPHYANLDIEFLGVIPQKEIGKILASANFTIHPGAFPETFGISSLESLLYNTPVITCRFGALEEIALEGACYLIDYAIEPNSLFTDIDKNAQVQKFAAMTINAYNNPYLQQQKQYYCNIVKPFASWDSVALQWKQHIFHKTNQYLSRDEYRTVTKINHAVHKIWKRRFQNVVEMETHRTGLEQKIVVISTFYNCQNYIARCIKSVAAQDYDNYEHILINDCSIDDTESVVLETIRMLPSNIKNKFTVITNNTRKGAVYNQVDAIRAITDSNTIVMILDGDDSLVNDNSIFAYYNAIYDGSTEFTYGSCWSMVDNIPLISQPYPEHIKQSKAYRQHKFNWNMPYTHLRTFKKYLIENIPNSSFQDENSNWFKAGGDGSTFYSLIEVADPDKVKCLQEIVYNYNDTNPLNDYKVNSKEQNVNASKILKKSMNNTNTKKKILIAIPTARNIEAETFKSIYDLKIPDGYTADFQYFYGYSRSQVKNLICDWAKQYDYTIFINRDSILTPTLINDIIMSPADVILLNDLLLFCAKKDVFNNVQYPHFTTKESETAELYDFVAKASAAGARVEYSPHKPTNL